MKLYTSKVIAKYLDVSERRVRQMRDENIITEYAPGLYELRKTINEYINYIRKGETDDEKINYNLERAKLVRAKRENEEFELQLKEGKLHSSEDIELVMSDMLINFKTRLMAIPAKLSPILSKKTDKAEIFQILKEAEDEALNELSDFKTVFAERLNNDEKADS